MSFFSNIKRFFLQYNISTDDLTRCDREIVEQKSTIKKYNDKKI